ncbi:ABC transporter substrate-binding protein [Lautropia dentalis]|jgi:extracellular solute-binding protein family 1|uniref:ABC transporter substrate-binding protein n=1 Tax=Lautropia dentalis TaxID=2490857 RepID=A0A3R8MQ39_9BURK|nr:ABC transporter substrate-binding protein [Lautropia dentalis]RRN43913.1 ABC transporter substrate-binding protein [Lautropia dentalis]
MKKILALATLALSLIGITARAAEVETRSLDEIYEQALKEGGSLTVYAGGDTPDQQDGIKAAFEKRFPGITLNVVVDYSKVHSARLDQQFEDRHVIPDIIQLQTLQDFPRWRREGKLVPYKPAGWDSIYSSFKDQTGAWTGVFVDAFSNVANIQALGKDDAPLNAPDYLKPELKGKIVSTYPNDDDAVLFWYKQTIDRHGWEWMQGLMKQQPHFVRGTQAPADEVAAGKYAVTFTSDGSLRPDEKSPVRFALPSNDGFVAWAQRAAIVKGARHLETARLYLNWLLDKDTQQNVWTMWSVRTDVQPPAGYKPVWEYSNANLSAFERFMADRDGVERFRSRIQLYVGDVQGPSSAGVLGMTPTRALDPATLKAPATGK